MRDLVQTVVDELGYLDQLQKLPTVEAACIDVLASAGGFVHVRLDVMVADGTCYSNCCAFSFREVRNLRLSADVLILIRTRVDRAVGNLAALVVERANRANAVQPDAVVKG